ncbi:MAG: UDP-3-O-(3-hydroxymyristoyl)glucosamine N-acyltransferase [Gammaproteobacteria bacterium]|nr:UDP-3-O-(3-hydroxymyristoyl)glucosamine N-acyltransferase [Gammaproteobacteria bacterium]
MITLSTIAQEVGGKLAGDPDFAVDSLNGMHAATSRSLTFYTGGSRQENPTTEAGAIILKSEHVELFPTNRIIVEDPYLAYAWASRLFVKDEDRNQGISPQAVVSRTATIADDASIGPFSVIGDQAVIQYGVKIGSGVCVGDAVLIRPRTVIEDRVVITGSATIGRDCVISSGAVIGSSGFGYARNGRHWQRIEQLGGVEIGDHVDVGANTTIDRGSLENTVIEDGVKLDNQIQIAHNVRIGKNTAIAGCVGIAGSARIGANCRIGGRAAILGHLEIADNVDILANTLVSKNIADPGEYASMIPAQPAQIWRKNLAALRRLGRLKRNPSTSDHNGRP